MLTTRQAKRILDYLAWLEDLLNLKEWKVQIQTKESPDEDSFAEVEVCEQRRLASVRFCDGFLDLEEEKIRHVLVHEMLHLHHEDVSRSLPPFKRLIGKKVYKAVHEAHRRHCELMVDQMAVAWAQVIRDGEWDARLMKRLRAVR